MSAIHQRLFPTSMDDSLATAFGFKRYIPGGSYNGGGAPTITGTNSFANDSDTSFYPYQTQDGDWRMRFNITGVTSAATGTTLTISGVTFKNLNGTTEGQAVAVKTDVNNWARGAANDGGVATMVCTCASSATAWSISGDVMLASKPTWAY